MAHLTWKRLGLVGVISGLAGWLVARLALSRGGTPLAVPWTVEFVCVAAGVTALVMAWSVRQYKRGKRPELSGLRAARTVVFAQASAFAGAAVAGAYGGYALALADTWQHAPRRETAITAILAAVAGLVLLVCGLIAEHWCKTDRHDDEDDHGSSPVPAH